MLQPQIEGALNGKIIDGKVISAWLRGRVRTRVAELREKGVTLTLAVLRVGDDPASALYVNGKIKACAEVGMESRHTHLPAATSEEDVLAAVRALNDDPAVDAILVQLPLPKHVNAKRVMDEMNPLKDADGFHPENLGRLVYGSGHLEPCTPLGVMVMLAAIGTKIEGANALVVGRSVIVGQPVSGLLLRANATVTTAHSRTRDLPKLVSEADIVVAATGARHLIKGEWVRPGSVVIDVGQVRGDDGKLAGDVEYDAAFERAGAITPVPGGVGPMTIACLLWNTVVAALRVREGEESAMAFHRTLTKFDV